MSLVTNKQSTRCYAASRWIIMCHVSCLSLATVPGSNLHPARDWYRHIPLILSREHVKASKPMRCLIYNMHNADQFHNLLIPPFISRLQAQKVGLSLLDMSCKWEVSFQLKSTGIVMIPYGLPSARGAILQCQYQSHNNAIQQDLKASTRSSNETCQKSTSCMFNCNVYT